MFSCVIIVLEFSICVYVERYKGSNLGFLFLVFECCKTVSGRWLMIIEIVDENFEKRVGE